MVNIEEKKKELQTGWITFTVKRFKVCGLEFLICVQIHNFYYIKYIKKCTNHLRLFLSHSVFLILQT